MNDLGLPIIGLGQRDGEYADLPLQWMPHIQVADVAASVRRAVGLGGSEVMHGRDDEGASPAAGICHARSVSAGLPPVWLLYLPVGDLAESLRRAEDEGGRVVTTARGQDGEYAYATLQDPVGVYVALAQAASEGSG
jgi:hypothetical protein